MTYNRCHGVRDSLLLHACQAVWCKMLQLFAGVWSIRVKEVQQKLVIYAHFTQAVQILI